jgi:diguanylate cyclase (GGDEF)-like protein
LDIECIRFFGGHLVQHVSTILLRQKSTETLKRQATIDGLTGALNRPAILDALTAQLSMANTSALPLSVLLTDVDFFTSINDNYGHPVGDAVLRELVRRFGMQCRARENFGRYGGKEFLFVLYPCPAEEAMQVGERIRRCIAETAFSLAADGKLKLDVSISLGACSTSGNPPLTADEMIQRADDALYLSKHQGRNRISLYAASKPAK